MDPAAVESDEEEEGEGYDSEEEELSPLHAAVEAGDLTRVQALVDAGADIEEKKGLRDADDDVHHDATPLYRAAHKGHVEVARYLIECGANKEAVGFAMGWTSVHVAAYSGHVEMVRMLIEHGMSKDAADNNNCAAVFYASGGGHVAVVEYLLEQGCDVDHASNHNGWTPLHLAAYWGCLEVARLLLRFGAKIDLRDDEGRTAADLATAEGHHDIANAIRAEEIRRRDHGFKRDRSTIEGTEEHAAAKRPRAEREAEEAAAAAAAAAPDESDDDDDDDDDEEDDCDEDGKDGR